MEEFHHQKCNTDTGDMCLDIYADENSTYIVIFTIVNTEKSIYTSSIISDFITSDFSHENGEVWRWAVSGECSDCIITDYL